MGLISCRAHLAAQREKAVHKTEGFVVSSRSKLDPYQDDLLYVCVIDSLTVDFLRGLPRNMKHSFTRCYDKTYTTRVYYVTPRRRNCNSLFACLFLCLHSRCYGYTHTPCILRIYISGGVNVPWIPGRRTGRHLSRPLPLSHLLHHLLRF